MKRKVSAIIIALISVLLLFSSCGEENTPLEIIGEKLSATIAEVNARDILVYDSTGGLYFVSTDGAGIYDDGGKEITVGELKPGMAVSIAYTNGIAETYPAQINNTTAISVVSTGTDKLSLYIKAVRSIYDEDTALNGKIIALDLNSVTSLDDGGKAALCYVLNNHYYSLDETQVICSDFDKLSAEGMIADLSFPDGVIIKIVEKDGSNRFSIDKWCSGTGAIGYTDCKGSYKNGEWTIKYDGAYIS